MPSNKSSSSSGPAPFAVHYSPSKVGAFALFVTGLSAWWAWRGIEALLKAEVRTFHLWFTPVLAIVLTGALLVGITALWRGRTQVLLIDQAGVTAPDLYEDRVPWSAIGGVTLASGRGVVFEVHGGDRYGRKITRNLKTSMRPGVPDMACIRPGLLDQGVAAILAGMLAHQAAHQFGASPRKLAPAGRGAT